MTQRVAIIGSGNWATAISIVVCSNVLKYPDLFDCNVLMWTMEEEVEGRKLTNWINEFRENRKYMPGVKLPHNLTSHSDLGHCGESADLLLMVVPHQFVETTCNRLKATSSLKETTKVISLVKGLFLSETHKPMVASQVIEEILQRPCSALSGANVAKDVANLEFSETTIGCRDSELSKIWLTLFNTPHFSTTVIPDVLGVQACGAIKNEIALAAGFCDGMALGTNAKSAFIRKGVEEMKTFTALFFQEVKENTFSESCGIADVITTCFGGRNVRCAAEFLKSRLSDADADSKELWTTIEARVLNGQKMQGQLTCQEVHDVVVAHGLQAYFPFFETIYAVAFEKESPQALLDVFALSSEDPKITLLEDCHSPIAPCGVKNFEEAKKLARKTSITRELKPHVKENCDIQLNV